MADVTSNLIAHWKFDGNGNDDSILGASHPLTISGITYINDKDGNAASAASYDGVNDSAYAAQHTDFDLPSGRDLTVACWVYRTTASLRPVIYNYNHSSGTSNGWSFNIASGGGLQWYMSDGGAVINTTGTTTVGVGAWHHVAVVVDRDGNATGYIDGVSHVIVDVSSYETKVVVSPDSTIGVNYIINDTPSEIFYDGSMDEFRVYQRALVQADITQLYENLDGNLPSSNSRFGKLAGIDRNKVISASGVDPDNIKSINGII